MAESIHFWENAPVRTSRRGRFWIPGERVTVGGKTYQRGPMFVEWEAPERVTQPYPLALVHGGALQGTEWLDTPDGRPGWAQRLVEAGYATFVVDRPGQGRSPYQADAIGPAGTSFPTKKDGKSSSHRRLPPSTHNFLSTQTTPLHSMPLLPPMDRCRQTLPPRRRWMRTGLPACSTGSAPPSS